MCNLSISIAFHKQHNPPCSPPHKASKTAPHFPTQYICYVCTK